ncbi:MAG: hypothetical protein AAF513_19400 [Pseudomonadota bacterium]
MYRPITYVLILTLLGGCGGPLLWFAGGKLDGLEQPWSAAAVPPESLVIQLETRPEEPYSVNVNGIVIDAALYVDPAPERSWYQYMAQDARVRVKWNDTVYAALAVPVSDPEVLANFEADRKVLVFTPR